MTLGVTIWDCFVRTGVEVCVPALISSTLTILSFNDAVIRFRFEWTALREIKLHELFLNKSLSIGSRRK